MIDQTADIQALIDAGGTVTLPAGDIYVTSLNLTGRRGVTLQGAGREATRLVPLANGANVLDLSGSGGIMLRDLRVAGHGSNVSPATGILMAQTQGYTGDSITLDHVRVDGTFTVAGVYNFSIASAFIIAGQFYSYNTAPALVMTGNNLFGAVSAWQIITNADNVPTDWTLIQTECHNMHPQGGWACWLGGAQDWRMYGGNMSAQGGHAPLSVNAVIVNGRQVNPARVILDGTTFYTDDGSHGQCAVSGMASACSFRANGHPSYTSLAGC